MAWLERNPRQLKIARHNVFLSPAASETSSTSSGPPSTIEPSICLVEANVCSGRFVLAVPPQALVRQQRGYRRVARAFCSPPGIAVAGNKGMVISQGL